MSIQKKGFFAILRSKLLHISEKTGVKSPRVLTQGSLSKRQSLPLKVDKCLERQISVPK